MARSSTFDTVEYILLSKHSGIFASLIHILEIACSNARLDCIVIYQEWEHRIKALEEPLVRLYKKHNKHIENPDRPPIDYADLLGNIEGLGPVCCGCSSRQFLASECNCPAVSDVILIV